jgi:hypothetical protein
VIVWNHDVPGDLPFSELPRARPQQARLQGTRAPRDGERLLVDAEQPVDEGPDRLRELAPGLSAPARLVSAFSSTEAETATGARNGNYAYFDVPSVNRKIESLTRHPELTHEVDAQWRRLDRQVMKLAPVGAVPQPRRDRLLQRRVRLHCYVNNVLYGFDYASICLKKQP